MDQPRIKTRSSSYRRDLPKPAKKTQPQVQPQRFVLTITPCDFDILDLEDEDLETVKYLLEIKEAQVNQRYLREIGLPEATPRAESQRPSLPPLDYKHSTPKKFMLGVPEEASEENQTDQGKDHSRQRADELVEQAVQIFDKINSKELSYGLAKKRLTGLIAKHLSVGSDVVPKARNKIGFLLLRNGLFLLIYILVFGEGEPQTKSRLFSKLEGGVQEFKAEFLENKAFQEDQMAVYQGSSSRRGYGSQDRPVKKPHSQQQSAEGAGQGPSQDRTRLGTKIHFQVNKDTREIKGVRRSTRNLGKAQAQQEQVQQVLSSKQKFRLTITDDLMEHVLVEDDSRQYLLPEDKLLKELIVGEETPRPGRMQLEWHDRAGEREKKQAQGEEREVSAFELQSNKRLSDFWKPKDQINNSFQKSKSNSSTTKPAQLQSGLSDKKHKQNRSSEEQKSAGQDHSQRPGDQNSHREGRLAGRMLEEQSLDQSDSSYSNSQTVLDNSQPFNQMHQQSESSAFTISEVSESDFSSAQSRRQDQERRTDHGSRGEQKRPEPQEPSQSSKKRFAYFAAFSRPPDNKLGQQLVATLPPQPAPTQTLIVDPSDQVPGHAQGRQTPTRLSFGEQQPQKAETKGHVQTQTPTRLSFVEEQPQKAETKGKRSLSIRHEVRVSVGEGEGERRDSRRFHFKVKRVVDPNVNNHGLFALVEVESDLKLQLQSKYALVYLQYQDEDNLDRRRRLSVDRERIWADRKTCEARFGEDIPIISMLPEIKEMLARAAS